MDQIETVLHSQHPVINLRAYAAGMCAGFSQTLLGQPLDLVKTYIQTAGRKSSMGELSRYLWKENRLNIFSYYRGSSTMFIGSGLLMAGELGLNESFQRLFRKCSNGYSNENGHMPMYQVALCGALTGVFSYLICTPMEFCKIQIQMAVPEYVKYSGSTEILTSKLLRGEISTLYRGGWACSAREIMGTLVYFSIYEKYLRWTLKPGQSKSQAENKQILLAGALAGFYHFAVYPLDVIKTQIQSGLTRSYR
jgi:solute carrier family 25 carnitine/acylcarnitine transporter 20/29